MSKSCDIFFQDLDNLLNENGWDDLDFQPLPITL